MITDFTAELTRDPGPATRADTALASVPRVHAKALHSDNGGASLMERRQPDHMRDNTSATWRWPSGNCAFSPADMDCTETSRRRSRICRRVLYSCRSICAVSRTPISCMRLQPPPLRAGASPARSEAATVAPRASTTPAMDSKRSARGASSGCSGKLAALPRSRTSSFARAMLAELSTAEAMPSRPSPGLSAQPATCSAGPASAVKSKPRPAIIRAARTSDATSAINARRQKLLEAGAARPAGRT
mmetsp:Transcript_87416/g.252076  ORF Transcript_87416/g.252076 Transcript_87416/m.252076 type:complete len:245 (-) Transcript_87416:55-789(-)